MDKHAPRRATRAFISAVLASLAIAAVLAPAALAQSAGDRQYADPLGGGGGQDSAPQQPQGGDTPTSSDAPAAAPDAGAGDTGAPPPGAEPAAEPAEALPRTGADPALLAALGALLLTSGCAVGRLAAAASSRP